MNKDVLITSGFPRSGNTFLNFALWQMYYPTEEFNKNFHTVKAIKEHTKVLIPVREPLGSVASWTNFTEAELVESCKYYTRFYTEAESLANKVVFVDFDIMITDLDYIKSLVKDNFNLDAVEETTVNHVKELMTTMAHEWNLPQNNQAELDVIKALLVDVPEFAACQSIYQEIKETL
jgi:hypothetical protein